MNTRATTLLSLLTASSIATADVLHDNGEPDGVNGYSNMTSGVFGFRRTLLDDFVVPEHETWHVDALRWRHIRGTPMGGGPPLGLFIMFRADEEGIPGPLLTGELDIIGFESKPTGRILFSREEEEAWGTFDPIALPPGHYWFEAALAGPENDFWLTASPIRHNECWVNYEDLGGFTSGTEQFGVAADLSWQIEGTREVAGVGACCLTDGQCFEMSYDACGDAGGLYQGTNVNCHPSLCGAPHACCFEDGTCRDETDLFCDALGGFYGGPGTLCERFQCVGSGFCMQPGSVYEMGQYPDSTTLADLDGHDGVDIITVNRSTDSLTTRFNDGTGGFGVPSSHDTIRSPEALAVADLDGDLDLDVVVVASFTGGVAVHLNDGSGIGDERTEYELDARLYVVALADLDGDLAPDIVTAERLADDVYLLFNDGAGGFGPAVQLAIDDPIAIAPGDVDGDLDNDLVITSFANDVILVLPNQGDGTFAAPIGIPTADGPGALVAHDLDADGDLDIAVACALAEQVSVFLNDGGGGFADESRYDTIRDPDALVIVERGAAAGPPDLAVKNDFGLEMSVLVNNSFGGFGAQRTYPIEGEVLTSLASGDVDGDGDGDLFVGELYDGLHAFVNDCAGCPGDLDRSGAIDFGDILRVLAAWGLTDVPEDLDGSGVVDFGDLLVVLGAWGVCG